MKKGFLLSLEGGDACGKTTQIQLLTKYFQEHNIDFVQLREPGSTEAGETIRNLLLHSDLNLDPRTEALLFNAARAQIVEEKIKPSLKSGKVVLMDRFYHSTLVYQGYAVDRDTEKLQQVIDFATGGLKTDLTLFLNVSAKVAFERKAKENQRDRFESRDIEFYNKVQNGFLTLAKEDPERVKIIDASDTIEGVHKQIVEKFEEYYLNN